MKKILLVLTFCVLLFVIVYDVSFEKQAITPEINDVNHTLQQDLAEPGESSTPWIFEPNTDHTQVN